METVNLGYLCVLMALGVCAPAEAKRIAAIEAPAVQYEWAKTGEKSVNLTHATPTLDNNEHPTATKND